ncbi:hypothetical protein LPICM02_110001 [Pseudolactococcus piscium]|nr:hypothetical protein LPICM02_110001 [Lactococcus piscium]
MELLKIAISPPEVVIYKLITSPDVILKS